MRRFLSVIGFVLGGWIAMTEAALAMVAVDDDLSNKLSAMSVFMVIAAGLWLLGTWASPSPARWRELGLAIILTCAVSTFCIVGAALTLIDPSFRAIAPPEILALDLRFDWPIGIANLLVLLAIGILLYRRGAGPGAGKS